MDLETLRACDGMRSLLDTDWAGDVSVQRRMRGGGRRQRRHGEWKQDGIGGEASWLPAGPWCLCVPGGNILCGFAGPSFGGQLCPGHRELARRSTDGEPCGLDDGPPRQDTSGRLAMANLSKDIHTM
jgi:hypothetical protein